MPRPPGQPYEERSVNMKFVANIKITQTGQVTKANGNGYFDNPVVDAGGTILNIEVTAKTLDDLVRKINSHASLSEELF